MKNTPLLNLVLSLLLTISITWILVVGRAILLPIVTAVIAVYVVTAIANLLASLPGLRRLPHVLIRVLVLLVCVLCVFAITMVIDGTVRDIAAAAPTYQTNLIKLLDDVARLFDVEAQRIWDEIEAFTLARIDLQSLVLGVLGGFTSLGATIFVVTIYAIFLISEKDTLERKIRVALGDERVSDKTMHLLHDINRRISEYLSIKTLINIVLGVMSYAILRLMGVDFALFWALTIATLNYIPYVGSYIAVALPVLLSLAQFASISYTITLLALLVTAQTFVGNYLEPRWIGRQVNLSPFVVLVALAVWAAIWGVPGAILSVPLTSVITIVLGGFDQTRFLAVLLSNDVDENDVEEDV
ncbi:AI-2E family transporter [Maritimibacter alkaliphilus]|uniref:AI-2E family transporter n=1 Tax=Maritimibacter alkaliphilus TaxID=404236 RepID=UPI001C948192|nr:AI-2E family transporter [Maritimibacter alkaliphilus]MBY6090715.1 AI-2E family transporter [Maritimibacter alkaliphilus]